jgi:PAP_fibrillin
MCGSQGQVALAPLQVQLPTQPAEKWHLTTYLDDTLRITRGDAGSIYVMVKERSRA